jgi:hypothetical protein
VHHRPVNLPEPDDSGAAQFQKPPDRLGTGGDAAVCVNRQDCPVIGDQRRVPAQRYSFGKAGEGCTALSRPGRPEKQYSGLADDNRGRMNGLTGRN